ncbi:SMI1/KNR4 family protein [Exiguobacterium acetylicum]|uniref:SMI1/KNR4 family protein n=1 Tax=Exiguobacterium acetylicum TaxID=41170 RepID=UPI0027E0056D|nr:SMI1/KNR4 family protein [Exiguobacterium acetylicum]MDQ6466400.1 SMI1/KNR4 family protein [Exiguobacterium acetylicum]
MPFWDEDLQEETIISVNETDITRIEQAVSSRLPARYLKQMRKQNGGVPEAKVVMVEFENTWSDEETGLHLPLCSMTSLTFERYLDELSVLREWDVEGNVMMFAEGEGSYFWYFHFTEDTEPTVWCLDISDETTHFVASTYDEWLTKLSSDVPEVFMPDVVFLTLPEIKDILRGDDENEKLLAYSHWMILDEEQEELIEAFMTLIERNDQPDFLGSYAYYLMEVLTNNPDLLDQKRDVVTALILSKGDDLDAEDLLSWMDEEKDEEL